MSLDRKKPKANLRKNYRIYLEFGLIVTLAVLILAMKIEFRSGKANVAQTKQQEVVKMKKVVRTIQKKQPPPPARPTVPVEVPNDKVLKDQEVNLDSDFDLNETLSAPTPPQNGGEGKAAEEKVFQAVQHQPVLQNKKGFYSGVEYPRSCKMAGIEGTVYVTFVVTETGNVTNARVVRGIGGGCDEYAVQYVLENAEFSPGRQRGKPVSVQFTLPVTFNLR